MKDEWTKKRSNVAESVSDHIIKTLQSAKKHLGDASPDAAVERGKVFQLGGYLEDAADAYAEGMGSKSNGNEAAARLALVQILSREPEKALATATELASRHPDFRFKESTSDQHVSALTVLGDALAVSGRLDEAIDAYTRARSTCSDDAAAPGRLAQLYLATGQPERALELEKDVARNPRFGHLSQILAAGRANAELLSRLGASSVAGWVAVTVHGRPMLAEEEAVVAPVVVGDAQWCR